MADREAYYERLTARGRSRRERQLAWLQRDISMEAADLLSYQTVQLKGEKLDMVIESTEVASTKKFLIPTSAVIGYGDYIVWKGAYWIVTERDYDDEIYIRGKMTQCNYYLRWQNEQNEIIGRWCVIGQVTRYNNGIFYGKVIDNIESTLSISIGNDEETAKLKRGKRFLADMDDVAEPYAYLISQRDVLTNYYGDSGLIVWAVSQDVYNPEIDNKELMIADYVEAAVSGIEGDDTIHIGHSSVYTSGREANWSIDSDFVILEISDDAAVIKVPKDRKLIGKSFVLTDGVEEKTIRICAVY